MQVQLHDFTAASAGAHGMHVHAVGKCEAPAFTTAGPHFNPASKQHGFDNPQGYHAGDLPNITVNADGSAAYGLQGDSITLQPNAPDYISDILDADGSALVIHASVDDYKTDPSGNSGTRIACGVFSATTVTLVGMPSTGSGGSGGLYLWLVIAAALLGGGVLAVRLSRAPSMGG